MNKDLKKAIKEEITKSYYDKCIGVVFGFEDKEILDNGRFDLLLIDCESKREYKETWSYILNDDIDKLLIYNADNKATCIVDGFSKLRG